MIKIFNVSLIAFLIVSCGEKKQSQISANDNQTPEPKQKPEPAKTPTRPNKTPKPAQPTSSPAENEPLNHNTNNNASEALQFQILKPEFTVYMSMKQGFYIGFDKYNTTLEEPYEYYPDSHEGKYYSHYKSINIKNTNNNSINIKEIGYDLNYENARDIRGMPTILNNNCDNKTLKHNESCNFKMQQFSLNYQHIQNSNDQNTLYLKVKTDRGNVDIPVKYYR
ncbi:hypothetical protein [Silvanigrella aquatica]|uniref:Lipoprotein n=1 Tax=Silvanigrella aquatica TaxID=1915309 RepID=A0A1L4CYF5_9BACT|nr:hypothetical protein [Silvanigrella aquatica]APJ02993.1 hypothetical protein AXG55_03310 [Silvanigrella aquatica]